MERIVFSVRKIFVLGMMMAFYSFGIFAQAPQLIPVVPASNQYPVTFTDPTQKVISIEFDQEILNLGNTTGWSITVGGVPAVFFGPIFDPGDHNIIKFQLSVAISYTNRNLVIVNYDRAASTASPKLSGAGGEVLSFGPITGINNLKMVCEMFDISRFDYSQTLTEICAPVNVIYTVTYYVHDYYVNSIHYNKNSITIRTYWNDGSPTNEKYGAEISPGVFRHTFDHVFPDNPSVCYWDTYIQPGIGGVGYCPAGGLRKSFTYQNHNLDNEGDAEFEMHTDTINVCLGQDFTEIFSDDTYFNCNPLTNNNFANDGTRHIRFTYGTNFAAGDRIQNILLDGSPIAGIIQGPVIKYDSIQANGVPAPSGWETTDLISHIADLGTDAVGQIYEITLENWSPCNPYDIFESNPPIITRSYIKIVDGPIANAGPDQTICEEDIVDLNGVIEHTATSGFWSTTTGDGSFTNSTSPGGATYSHGNQDLTNGGVWLILHADDGLASCPENLDSMYVTINPIPEKNLAVSDDTECAGSPVSVTVTNIQAGVEYTLRREPGNTLVDGPKTGAEGTDIVFNFTPSPATTATYNVLAVMQSTGCDVILTDKSTVTVNPLATITAQPPNRTICEGLNTTFTATAAGPGIVRRWQENQGSGWNDLNNVAPYGGTTTATLTITNVTPAMNGYQYRLKLTTTGSCVRYTNAGTLTVNPKPFDRTALAVDPFLCYNTGTIIRIESAQDGVSYTINNGVNPSQSLTQAGSSDLDFNVGPFSPALMTNYNYTITAEALTCTRTLTSAPQVRVNANVILNAISHPDLCEDAQIDLPDAPASGGSIGTAGLGYAWTGTSIAGIITDKNPAPFNPTTTGLHNVNLLVTDVNFRDVASTDNTVCTATRNMSFTVKPLPLEKDAIITDPYLCYNTGTVLRVENAEDGVSYTINNGVHAPQTLVQSGGGHLNFDIGPFTPALMTTYTYTISATVLGCPKVLADQPQVTVNANVSLTPISHPDICEDAQIDLPDAPASGGSIGTAGFSYAWTGTSIAGSINLKNPAPFDPTTTGIHNINLLVTDANFRNVVSSDNTTCTDTENMSFEVYEIPLNRAVVAQASPVCYNYSTNIIIQSSQAGIRYDVYRKSDDSFLGSANGNGGNASVSTGNLISTTQYYVIAENITTSCNFRLSDEPTVIVNPRFQLAQLHNNQSICINSSTNFRVNMTGGQSPYTLVYSDGTDNFTINNYLTGQNISTGILASTVTYNIVSVVDVNGCPVESTGTSITITVGSSPTSAILSGGGNICFGSDATLSVNISGGAPPYTVNISNGIGIYVTPDYLSDKVVSGLAVGPHTYNLISVLDNCGNSVPGAGLGGNPQVVTVDPIPNASGTTNNDPTICNSGTSSITLASTVPSTNFTWTVEDPNSAGAAAGSGVIGGIIAQALTNNTDNAIHVIYHITPAGPAPSTCPGAVVDRTVQIEPTPKAAIVNGSAEICTNGNVNLNITSPTIPTIPGDLTFDLAVTSDDDANLSGTAKANLTGQSFPLAVNGTLINSSDDVIEVTFTVTPKLNGCANGTTVNTKVYVQPAPKGVFTNNALKICNGGNVNIDISSPTVPSTPANLLFDLTVISSNPGATGGTAYPALSNQSFPYNLNGTLTNSSNDDITITYTLTPKLTGCVNGTPQVTTVVVEPTPKAAIANSSPKICNNSVVDLVISSPTTPSVATDLLFDLVVTSTNALATGGAAYNNLNNQSFPLTINSLLTNSSNDDITVTFTVTPKLTGCGTGANVVTTVVVEPTPIAAIANSTPLICQGGNVNLVITSPTLPSVPADRKFDLAVSSTNPGATGGAAYTALANQNFPRTINGPLTNSSDEDIIVTFTVTPKITGCANGTPVVTTVVVEPTPKAVVNNLTPKICVGGNVNLQISSPTIPSVPGDLTFDVTLSSTNPGATSGTAYTPLSNESFPFTINGTLNNTSNDDITVTFTITTKLDGCASGTPVVTTVVVEPSPKGAFNNTTPKVCNGSNVNIVISAVSIPSVPADLKFNLDISSSNDGALGGTAATDLLNQAFPLTINGNLTNSSDEDILVTYELTPMLNGCADGSPITTTVIVEPTPKAAFINNAIKICQGGNVDIDISSLTIPSVPAQLLFDLAVSSSNPGATGGAAYTALSNQSFPRNLNGILTNTSNDDITVTFTVTPKLTGCASGTPQVTTVVVEPSPKAAINNSTAKICNNSNVGLIISSPTVPAGGTDLRFDLVVTSTNAGATGGAAFTDLNNQTFPLTINGLLSNSSNDDITVTFTVTPKLSGCANGTNVVTTVIVEPTPIAAVANSTTLICQGANVNIGITSPTIPSILADRKFDLAVASSNPGATGGAAYATLANQNFPMTINGSLTNTSNDVITVTFTVTPKLAGCTSGVPVVTTVNVEPSPKAVITNSSAKICQGGNVDLQISSPTVPTVPGDLSFDVAVSSTNAGATGGAAYTPLSGQTAPFNINGILTNSSNDDITVTFTVTPKLDGCASGTPVLTTVVVEPTPRGAFTNTTPKVCQGGNVNIVISAVSVPSVPAELKFNLDVSSTNDGALGGTSAGDRLNQSFPLNLNGTLTNSSDDDILVTYTLTPLLNGCTNGPDVVTTVVIEPTPRAAIINNDPVICHNSTVDLQISSSTVPSVPANLTFDLVVTSTNGAALGGTASTGLTSQSFPRNIAGTLTNSSNAAITVTYTVTPKLNGCANGPVAITTVIVEPTPKAAIGNSTPEVCNGSNVNLPVTTPTVPSVAGDLVFDLLVTSTNGPALGGSASSSFTDHAFPFTINGTLTNSSNEDISVTFTVTPKLNGCASGTPVSTIVIVEPTPMVDPVNTTPTVCNNSNVNISINSLTSPSVASDLTFDVVVTSTNDANLGGTATADLNDVSAGTVINGTLTNSSFSNITVTFTITPKLNGCSSGAVKVTTVVVYPVPNIIATNHEPIISTGSQTDIELNGNVAGTVFGWRVLNPGTSGATDGSGLTIGQSLQQTLTNILAIPVTITYRIAPSANGCPGDSIDVSVQIDPNVNIDITNNAPEICTADNTDIIIESAVLGTTFTWTVNDPGMTGATAGAGGPNTHTIQQNLVNTGTTPVNVEYTFTPTGPAPTFIVGTAKSTTVTVYPKPEGLYTNRTPRICNGSASNILLDSDVAGTSFTWTVSDPSGTSGAGPSGTAKVIGDSIYQVLSNPGTVPITITYHIRPTGQSPTLCAGDIINIEVIVDPTPIANVSNVAPVICSETETDILLNASVLNSTFVYSVVDPKGTGATGGTANAGERITQELVNPTQTSVTITYEIIPYGPVTTSCPGAAVYVNVTVNPLPNTTAITGPSEACVNTPNLFYSVTLTPGSTYDWTVPASLGTIVFGGDGLNSSAVIINAAAAGSIDSIRLIETNQYSCVGSEILKPIVISPQVVATTITGPANVCDSETAVLYSIPENPGSVYQWFVPTGSGIVTDPSTDSVAINFGSISGIVRVIETNYAGCITNHDPLFVVVNPLPASVISVNKTNICLGETVTFTAGPAAQANYEFFVNGVSARSGPSNIYITDSITHAQQVYVDVTTATGCSKLSTSITMNVFDNPVVSLTSSDADNIICNGEYVTFTASAPSAVAYEFFINGVSAQNSSLTLFSTNGLADLDEVYFTGTTMFGCEGSSSVIVTTVNPLPAGVLSGDNIICSGDSTAISVNISAGLAPYTIQISSGGGIINGYLSNDPVYVHPMVNTTYILEEIIDANGCSVNAPNANLTGTATITLNQNVLLGLQPNNAVVCEGIDTSFSITGSGTGLTIQWQADDGGGFVDIADIAGVYSGVNTRTLDIINPASSLSGYVYRAVLSGTCGFPVNSNNVTLSVYENPEIITQPISVSDCEGVSVMFTADAGLTTNPAYQWQLFNGSTWNNLNSGAPYTGVNNDTLIVNPISSALNGNQYRIRVTGLCSPGVNSDIITLVVNERPEIVLQPVDVEICEGEAITYTISTGVTTAATVQWQVFDGTIWSNATGGVYLNDNTPVLTIDPVSSSMNGYEFRAVVGGTCGPEVTSLIADLIVNELPEISLNPLNVTACEGDIVTFETATGATTNAVIQWQVYNGSTWENVSGLMYSGANSTILTINGVTSAMHNNLHKAIVSGECNPAVESTSATLSVNEKPEFTLQPLAQDLCEGSDAVYTINTGVTTNPVIQWQVWDGTTWTDATGAPYSGETTSSLLVSGVTSAMNNFKYRAHLEGTCSPAINSSEAVLSVREAPEVTIDPSDLTVCEGLNAVFNVEAGVTSSPVYQWLVSTDNGSSWNPASGAGYTGANTATLTVLATNSGMNGWQFSAEISGSCPGTIQSASAVLGIYEKPEITTQPADQVACEDGSVVYAVDATPTSSPAYLWEVNDGGSWYNASGIKYTGQGTPSLTVTGITSSMSGYNYRVTISGTCTPAVISNTASLLVHEKPEIIQQASDVTLCEGEPASFTINAGATSTPAYRWEVYDGTTWTNAVGGIYSNENTPTINLSAIPSSMNGYLMRAIVSGECAPEITSTPAVINVRELPEIDADPVSVTICEADSAIFVVSAGLTTEPSYKWQVYNGSAWSTITGGIYSGFNSDTLHVNGAGSFMNNYRYRAVVSGICSPGATSAEATLTVRERPEVSLQPISISICEDSPASFEVNAGLTVGAVYQWQVDQNTGTFVDVVLPDHSGMNTPLLSISSGSSLLNGYKYMAVITGTCGPAANSSQAILTILEKPEVALHPRDTVICEGESARFTVAAGLTANPQYRWMYNDGSVWQDVNNGGNVNGANTSTLNIYSIDSAMTTYMYKAVISGACSPDAESNPAILSVNTAPLITVNPQDIVQCEFLPVVFHTDAVGTNMSYSWQIDMRDGLGFRNLGDTAGIYSGTGTKDLSVLSVLRRMDSYRYRARVAGLCNPASNSAFAVLNVNTAPEISVQPIPKTICEYSNVTFNVEAQGGGLNYLWQESSGGPFYDLQDTGSYIGTTSASMSVYNISRTSNGKRYRVIISGNCNPPVVSSEVILTVNTSPEITSQPVDDATCQDNDASYTVIAEGTNLSYQWQLSTGGPFNIITDNATYSGTTSNILNITSAGAAMNNYRYRVTISGTCSPVAVSNQAFLSVNPNPQVTVNPASAEICENGNATMTAGATGIDLTLRWQVFTGGVWNNITDDLNYSGSETTVLSISNAPVSLTNNRYRLSVNNACAAVYSAEATLLVNANPLANITGNGSFPLVCGGFDLNLNGNPAGGSGTYTNHSWTGDIVALNSYNASQTVFNTLIHGIYNLNYTVTDSKGCMTSTSTVIENDRPNSQFTSDASPSCGYRLVNFNNTSTGAINYEWHFDDGSAPVTSVNAQHGFDNMDPGGLVQYYDVKLVSQSAKGCRDTANSIVTIYPKVDPEFTMDPDTACQPFLATMYTKPGAAAYNWNFGDGQQENAGYTINHLYINTGTTVETYTITLKTTSFYGCVATASKEIVVYPLPSANFSVAPILQTFPDATVEISNLVSPGPWTYLYTFGDGSSSDLENPTHTYAESGVYRILQVVSSGFCSDSIGQTITINPRPPVAAFDAPESACSPMMVHFVNNSQYANSYKWDFGDGSISTKKDPVYTYFEPGIYVVSLVVSGPGGSSQFRADIEVWPSPAAYFNHAPDSVFVNDKPVKFFNFSTDAIGYIWDFGDVDEETGETSTLNNSEDFEPSHKYETVGWKDVKLVIYNEHCSDTLIKEDAVFVSPAGHLRFPNVFKPNPFGPIGGTVNPNDPTQVNMIFRPGVLDRVLEYNLYIYNRWGELVFRSDDVNVGWDGYINGSLARQGVYVWKVKGKYTNGRTFVEVGDVTLLH